VSGVNNYLNSNHMKYLAQLCTDFFAFWKILTTNLQICGATYRQNCEMFYALQSTSSPLTDGENSIQIDA